MAIALDMTFANRNRGGSGVYAHSLMASLRERDDVAAWVISGPSKSNPVRTMQWLTRGARKALDARPPNLLHCPSFVAPWRIPVPTVVTVHDAGARRAPEDHPLEWKVYDRALMPRRLRAAARVITGTEFSRREVIEAYELNPDRVEAIPYGLDVRWFKHPDKSAGTSGPMLFPGAPVGRKNLEAVLRSMAASSAGAVGRTDLEISGARAEDFPESASLIRSLGLESRVRWLGHLSPDEMVAVTAKATVVVYPSLYEGFGFPPLEAMAAGTPVVASNRGSLPEILGDAALLVDPTDWGALGEALDSVLTRPELRERLSEAGRTRARAFSWEKCTDRTIEVYRAVISESSASGS